MTARLVFGSMLLLLFSCNYTEPAFVTPPQMLPNPNGKAPLVTFLEVSASEPVRVIVTINDGAHHRWEYQVPGRFKQAHRVPIFQLLPASNYKFEVSLMNTWRHRSKKAQVVPFQTLDWSADYPSFKVTKVEKTKRRPGFHLLSMSKLTETGAERGFLVAINWRGDVMWLWEQDTLLKALILHENGHILGANEQGEMVELDLLGNVFEESDLTEYRDTLAVQINGGKRVVPILKNRNLLQLDKSTTNGDRLWETTLEKQPRTVLEIETTEGSRIHAIVHLPSLWMK